jgi:signal transduction histidine kinase
MRSRTKLWLVMLISVASSIILFLVTMFVSGSLWDKGYSLNILNTISQETRALISEEQASGKEQISPILDTVHQQHPELRLEWVAADGTVIYDTSHDPEKRYEFAELAYRVANMPNNMWGENAPITLVYQESVNGNPFFLILNLNGEAMKMGQFFFYVRTYESLIFIFLPLLWLLVLPYLFTLWYFSSINRRIGKLNQALAQVGLRKELIVLYDKSKDEIGELARHYNAMAQRIHDQAAEIEQFDSRRRLLLSNLSHDLRTPLTMILGYAETIRTHSYKEGDELQNHARIILQRSRYMDSLLDQLLDITKQDSNVYEFKPVSVSVSELIRKVAADYFLFLDGQNIEVDVDVPEELDAVALVDASLIERALRNLIDNAIRYGSGGQYLGIAIVRHEEWISIYVKDRGKGIEPEYLNRIFERFYRVDDGRRGEGLGIGLSFVRDIMELHCGQVLVSSKPNKETVFELRFPKQA